MFVGCRQQVFSGPPIQYTATPCNNALMRGYVYKLGFFIRGVNQAI
jgi:hypothetical protein